MGININLIIGAIAIFALGVWYFLAGVNGWKYPRVKFEYDDENSWYHIEKIFVGVGLIVVGIAVMVTEFSE